MSITLTQDLEDMVKELASHIQNYPKSNRETIVRLAKRLDDKVAYGQKQKYKDTLIELLGYNTKGNRVSSSLQTIPKNIIYLVDLEIKDVRKVVNKLSNVLEYDIENTMNPRVEYLKSIGVKDIGKVVTKLPGVLEYDIENTMKPRVEYLKSIGVKDIGKVVTIHPQVLELDIENTMKPRVEYLKSIGVKDIGKIVTRLPQVLGYSIENNLKPTYKFLTENFGITVKDIVNNPSLLGYSLEKRIKPRYKFLKSKGLDNKYNINYVLALSDEEFCFNLKFPLKDYLKFKEIPKEISLGFF